MVPFIPGGLGGDGSAGAGGAGGAPAGAKKCLQNKDYFRQKHCQ